MIKDFFLISFRNLRKRKVRSWLTMLGIFIGIAAVVSLISLGEGLRDAVGTQFANLGTDKLTVQAKGGGFGPPGSGVAKKLTDKDFDVIEGIEGIKEVAKRYVRVGSMEFNDQIEYGYATSIPEYEGRKLVEDTIGIDMELGRFLKREDNKKVVLGYSFYGEDIYDKPIVNGNKVLINDEEFEVVGILEKSGSLIFDGAVYMNEEPLKELLEIEDEIDIIAIQVGDENEIPRIVEDIEKQLRKTRDAEEGKEDFTVETPQDILESLNTIVSTISIVLVGIAAISLLVGGIGIMNTMYTSVLERTKEIGIMKSIGARNSSIFYLFLVESGLLGLAGGIIGIILGYILAKIVEYAAMKFLGEGIIQVTFPIWLILGALGFAFLVGTISGVLPAVQASKMKPVDALRFRK